MKVKVKLLTDNAQIPVFGKTDDAGADLTVTDVIKEGLFKVTYKFGIAVELPLNYYAMIVPRSSVRKTFQWLSNSCGIIDNGYRGEIQATFYRIPFISTLYKVGERACQLIVRPQMMVVYTLTDKLTDTQRGDGGFGSTGK